MTRGRWLSLPILLLLSASSHAATLALVGANVYQSPDRRPIAATVLIDGDRITTVAPAPSVRIPHGAEVVDCAGLTVVAGFWNSHIHLADPQWEGAATLPAERLSQQLERMLTRYGFTTVFDIGSGFENTDALRRRVSGGEVTGPRILTTGEPLVAVNGTPYYVKPVLLPELTSAEQARSLTAEKLERGADAIKLFTGAVTDREHGVRATIATDLVRAVTDEAHRRGRPVFAHPQSEAGLRAAVDGGVDALAHVTEELTAWPPEVLSRALKRRTALIPTLKLLAGTEVSPKQQGLLRQVHEFSQRGGRVLFGTDIGFITDYDPTEEYVLLQQAGMTPRQILASLTTEPAKRFRPNEKVGRIQAGYAADIVVIEADPAADVRRLARVRYTIRGGRITYKKSS